MKRIRGFSFAALIVAITLALVPSIGVASDNGLLAGSVKSAASGEAIVGATVSAKVEGQSITTSVFTDEQGDFYFPATLPSGKYQVWAQTTGYDTGRAEVVLSGSLQRQGFVLKPVKDVVKQLTGRSFFQSLPEDTPQHRRMKEILYENCTGCHDSSYILQNRFDEKGWTAIINLMSRISTTGEAGPKDAAPASAMLYYKKELAAYLAEIRGPGPSSMQIVTRKRPTGDAARVVVVEYDVTDPNPTPFLNPDGFTLNDGSDWSRGTPSMINGGHDVHDSTLDFNGNIWYAMQEANPRMTVGMVNAKTGKMTDVPVPGGPRGMAQASHGIATDSKGMIWFTLNRGGVGMVDPKTLKVETYPYNVGGGSVDVDANGNVWVETGLGAFRLNPKTRTFKDFPSVEKVGLDGQTPFGSGGAYGVAVDREGNGWWTQFGIDRIDRADSKTSEVAEIKLGLAPSIVDEDLTADDRKFFELAGNNNVTTSRPGARGPRRMAADKNGDALWVALYWSDELMKTDTHTMKTTFYKLPERGSNPYATAVDSEHNVWVNISNSDSVLKFEPKTGKWTEYQLPTKGGEPRHVAVSSYDGKIHVALAEPRVNKVARIDFRTAEEVQSLKKQVQQQAGLR